MQPGQPTYPPPSQVPPPGYVPAGGPPRDYGPGTPPGAASPPPGYVSAGAAPPPGNVVPGAAPSNGTGTAALVLGILALVTSFFLVGGLLGLIGLVLGVVALGKVRRGMATNRGSALAGTILSALGILITIGIVAVGASFYSSHKSQINDLQHCLNRASGDQAAQRACQDQFQTNVTR